MANPGNARFACEVCETEINEEAEFCPNCGALFATGHACTQHPSRPATGVCVICCLPYCDPCLAGSGKVLLCGKHAAYEICEGHARVYGSREAAMAEYARKNLAKNDLHPILFSRKASPLSIGGADYTLFRASGDNQPHLINEIKLMVPCPEVPAAEQLLRDLELL